MTTRDAPSVGAVVRRTFALDLEQRAKDDPGSPIAASIASEEPVERPFGREVLVHTKRAVRLDRAARGLPLLLDHNPTAVIGRAEHVRIEGRRLRADLRFGRGAAATEVRQDVLDSIRTDVSVGYEILRAEHDEATDTVRVVEWRPVEVSLVALAADVSVGIGRAAEPASTHSKEPATMNAPNPERIETRSHESKPNPVEVERERVLEIQSSARRWNVVEVGERAITEGWPLHDFRAWLLANAIEKAEPLRTPASEIGMGRRDVQRFSILRAAQALATRDWRNAGLEREASDAVEQKLGRAARGFFVPGDVLHAPSVRAVTKAGSGGSLIETELRPESFIEALRNAAQVRQAGATILPGLVGNIDLPRQTGTTAAEWLGEAATVTGGDPTFDVVAMSPRTVAGRTQATRKMLLQSTPAIEQVVREDLAQSLALAIDRAATFGSAVGAEPRGIINVVGVASHALGTNGAALTWADVVELESLVAEANADGGAMAYLTNARVRGALKVTEKSATSGMFVWPDRAGDASVNGRRALVSNQIPSNLVKGSSGATLSAMIFGNWRDLLIAEWGVLDVSSEGITLADSGGLTIRAFLDVDIAVRHPESFAICTDIIA